MIVNANYIIDNWVSSATSAFVENKTKLQQNNSQLIIGDDNKKTSSSDDNTLLLKNECNVDLTVTDEIDCGTNYKSDYMSGVSSNLKSTNHFENLEALVGSFGNVLCFTVNKAADVITEVGNKIKRKLERNSFVNKFNKEQEKFIKSQNEMTSHALPSWVAYVNEKNVKEEYLLLSTDKRNFLHNPPEGIDFNFDYDIYYPVAIAIMKEDLKLQKMRFDLVPKIICERVFWRNYFYRVKLICRANEQQLLDAENINRNSNIMKISKNSKSNETVVNELVPKTILQNWANNKKCPVKSNLNDKWENELESELQDYIADENKLTDSKDFEKDIVEILEDSCFK